MENKVTLEYKNTFLQVVEAEVLIRSRSAPTLKVSSLEGAQEEQQLASLCRRRAWALSRDLLGENCPEPCHLAPPTREVSTVGTFLMNEAPSDRPGATHDNTASQPPAPATATAPSANAGENPGSRGHPQLCKRPCAFAFASAGCREGASCGFCHRKHTQRPFQPLPWQRRRLQQLSNVMVSQLMLPHLWAELAQAKGSSLQRAMQKMLRGLEAWLAERTPPALPAAIRNEFQEILERMKLTNMISLLSQRQVPIYAEELEAARRAI
ncbi:unnamed protein product [Effrenium voratum]|nr:unnamed protein product [Effrenium voratum]